jgi:hypothetical protein
MKYGYARVSPDDQNAGLQLEIRVRIANFTFSRRWAKTALSAVRCVPFTVGLRPPYTSKSPRPFLCNGFVADLMEMGEASDHWETNRPCSLLKGAKHYIEVYGFGMFWRENFFIKTPLLIPNEDLAAECYGELSRINQIDHDAQYVIPWLFFESPIGKVYPLIELGLHQIGLALYGIQGLQGQPASNESDADQKPAWDVCRGEQFAPWIFGRFFIGFGYLFGGGILYLDGAKTRLSRGLAFAIFGLGWLLFLAPVPWDLGPCPADASQQQT